MNLTDQLTDYIRAAFTGLWVQTHEPDEAEREIAQHARQQGWRLAVWDIAGGLRFPNAPQSAATDVGAGGDLSTGAAATGHLGNPVAAGRGSVMIRVRQRARKGMLCLRWLLPLRHPLCPLPRSPSRPCNVWPFS
jgi:hypothetical protein